MAAKTMVYPVFFILLTLIMLVLVPRRRIVGLLPFGLIAGAGVALVVQTTAIWYLGLWRWRYLEPFGWRGLPLFISATWIPAEIIFAHYIEETPKELTVLYILGFAGIATGVEWWFVRGGYQVPIHWSLLYTFILGVVIHTLLSLYVLAIARRRTA
ncbi:MAG: hypothetical protein ACM3ZQ_09815 [Bacillota bacterium]